MNSAVATKPTKKRPETQRSPPPTPATIELEEEANSTPQVDTSSTPRRDAVLKIGAQHSSPARSQQIKKFFSLSSFTHLPTRRLFFSKGTPNKPTVAIPELSTTRSGGMTSQLAPPPPPVHVFNPVPSGSPPVTIAYFVGQAKTNVFNDKELLYPLVNKAPRHPGFSRYHLMHGDQVLLDDSENARDGLSENVARLAKIDRSHAALYLSLYHLGGVNDNPDPVLVSSIVYDAEDVETTPFVKPPPRQALAAAEPEQRRARSRSPSPQVKQTALAPKTASAGEITSACNFKEVIDATVDDEHNNNDPEQQSTRVKKLAEALRLAQRNPVITPPGAIVTEDNKAPSPVVSALMNALRGTSAQFNDAGEHTWKELQRIVEMADPIQNPADYLQSLLKKIQLRQGDHLAAGALTASLKKIANNKAFHNLTTALTIFMKGLGALLERN